MLTPLEQLGRRRRAPLGGRIGRDFAPERQQDEVKLFDAVDAHVRARRQRATW